jgi:N-methylhydantoinase A
MSDVKHDYLRSRLADIGDVSADEVTGLFSELRTAAAEQLGDEGFPEEKSRFRYFLDMRYTGQGYENPVPLDGMPVTPADLTRYRARFDDIHRTCHGHAAPGQPVEIVNYRVEAIGLVPRVGLARLDAASGPAEDAQVGTRDAFFSVPTPGTRAVPVYDRDKLRAGHEFAGPAVVDQYDATTVVCPGQVVKVDPFGNLLVETVDA